MKLMRNLVQIKVKKADETFKGGIIHKPDNLKVAAPEGVVTAVGPTVGDDIKVGQRVLYGRHSAQELDEDYVLVIEDDILAVL